MFWKMTKGSEIMFVILFCNVNVFCFYKRSNYDLMFSWGFCTDCFWSPHIVMDASLKPTLKIRTHELKVWHQ